MKTYEEMMLDTFEQIVQIGEGGGGTVFRAHHKRLDKDVVLKKIHTSQLKNVNRRGELDILKNLKHNYIPQIFDFIEYGDDVFIVMEYIPGQSFAQLLADNTKFTQKQVVKWLRQLCEVVNYLHEQNPPIIHCDIKPANVMLTPQGDICLIDFNISGVKTEEGIASIGYTKSYAPVEQFAVVTRRYDDRTEVPGAIDDDKTEVVGFGDDDRTEVLGDDDKTEVLGAPLMTQAPTPVIQRKIPGFVTEEEWNAAKKVQNSLKHKPEIDERTDIYSMGATFYHILSGKKPQPFYYEQTPLSEINENYSESLVYVIEKAMQTDPSKRFADSGQMLKAVQNMGLVDKRYKALVRKQILTAAMMGILIVVSVFLCMVGKSEMQNEKQEQYVACIAGMQEARGQKDYDTVVQNYEKALALSAEETDAYYEMSLSLYAQKQYQECIEYLSDNVYNNSMVLQEDYDKFYYVTASCYLELEDYSAAASYYERALKWNSAEISYYRDYVIALARTGNLEEAEKVLEQAVEKGISADDLSLLNGEIALLTEDYTAAEKHFKECISLTEDDYTKLRAYTKLDDTYRLSFAGTEQYDMRIVSLQEALKELPKDSQVTLLERLAQVYIEYSDVENSEYYCGEAISLFKQMEENSYATYTSRANIAVLYQKMGKYDEAQKQLEFMLTLYADNYNIYKRMAYVELESQSKKANENRDYYTFEEYYKKALELYQENSKVEDMEMLSLQQLYNDVVTNGWL